MAYNPIQLPNNMGIVPGSWPGLATGVDAFFQARAAEQELQAKRAAALLDRERFGLDVERTRANADYQNRQVGTQEEAQRRLAAKEDREGSAIRNANIRKALAMAKGRPIEAAAALQQEGVPQEDIERIVRESQDDDAAMLAGGAQAPAARAPAQPMIGQGPPQGIGAPRQMSPQGLGPTISNDPDALGPSDAELPPPAPRGALAPPPMQQDATGLPTGPGQAAPQGFDQWYAGEAQKLGINPNPDDPRHHYDYRAFYKAMLAGQVQPPEQTEGHFSSQFKTDGNEREMLKDRQGRVFNTRSGAYADGSPVSEEELRAATTAPTLSPQGAQGPPQPETPDQANQRRARILRFRDPKTGNEVTFDREEEARATAIEKQKAFAQLDAGIKQYGQQAPHIARYLADTKALLASDAIKPSEVGAWIQKMYATDVDADSRVRAAAARPRSDSNEWRRDQGERHLSQDEEVKAFALAERVLKAGRYEESRVKNNDFNDMATKLAIGNAALDTSVAGSWVKQAQGGSGVLSDQDMDQFWKKIGSATLRTEAEIDQFFNGKMSDAKRKVVGAAVHDLARLTQQKLDKIQADMEWQFKTSPNFGGYKDQVIGSYFPSYRAKVTTVQDAPLPSMTDKRRARVVRSGGKEPAPAAGDPAPMDADVNGLLDLLMPKKPKK